MTVKNRTISRICVIFVLFVAISLQFYRVSEQSRKKDIILSRMESYVAMAENVQSPDNLVEFIPGDIRITFTDSLGNVTFDSYGNVSGSHADRPEIREAMEKGAGVSLRESETSSLPYIYYARRCADGRIVRVAQVFDLDLQHFMRTDWALLSGIVALAFAAMMGIYILVDKAHRHERELSEQEKRRLKHEMTGNISHELKTPVASIQGYLEILVTHKDCPEDKKQFFIERAYAQTIRLGDLIRDISLVTKMEEVPQLFPMERLFLKASLDQIIEEMSDKLASEEMKCRNLIPEGCEINANSQLVYAVFRNLIENSLKYAGKGSEITIEGNGDGEVTYVDNGAGIAEEDLPHIFERFWRNKASRSDSTGSGLGLSIVRNAVLLHGGSINAYVPQPHGLGFVINFGKRN